MEKLIHLLIPRESNNHRAKILHTSSLLMISLFMVLVQGIINIVPKLKPGILGYASNISIQEVVNLTNQKRTAAGLSELVLNQTLSGAAYTKGQDMLAKDYWAHVAPDGTQPWKFFSDFGYRYRYAGENLARDFSNATDAVNAWMNSPTHRENILNPKYKEIGIGIVEGDLSGSDTTLIVQFFGSTYADKVNQPLAQAVSVEEEIIPEVVETPTPNVIVVTVPTTLPTESVIGKSESNQEVLISPFTTTRLVSFTVVLLLLLIFVVDAILVSRRKIARIAGRTFAHISFLGMILIIILILKSGSIL